VDEMVEQNLLQLTTITTSIRLLLRCGQGRCRFAYGATSFIREGRMIEGTRGGRAKRDQGGGLSLAAGERGTLEGGCTASIKFRVQHHQCIPLVVAVRWAIGVVRRFGRM
jgi:hypothetical protein